MKNLNKLWTLLFVFFCITLNAQIYVQTNQQEEMSSFTTQNSQLDYLSSQNRNIETKSSLNVNGNNIFISQTGENNVVNSTTKSQQSDIRIIQDGNFNYTALNLEATTIQENVIQEGNNNTFRDFNVGRGSVNFHSGEIIQRGDNHKIDWYGGNSISEKLQVSQQGIGSGKTILIRSFN